MKSQKCSVVADEVWKLTGGGSNTKGAAARRVRVLEEPLTSIMIAHERGAD
jgi:hypothetical protein